MAKHNGWSRQISIAYWREQIKLELIEWSPTGELSYWFDEGMIKELNEFR
jgi:hypothetical protein